MIFYDIRIPFKSQISFPTTDVNKVYLCTPFLIYFTLEISLPY